MVIERTNSYASYIIGFCVLVFFIYFTGSSQNEKSDCPDSGDICWIIYPAIDLPIGFGRGSVNTILKLKILNIVSNIHLSTAGDDIAIYSQAT